DPQIVQHLCEQLARRKQARHEAVPLIDGVEPIASRRPAREVRSPAQTAEIVGWVRDATDEDIHCAFERAAEAFSTWSGLRVEARVEPLECAAALLESEPDELMALLVREAGKTIPDAIAEIRETI